MVQDRSETELDRIVEALSIALPPVFARHRLTELTGGLFNSRTIANRMSLGDGPPGVMIGRRVGLSRESFIEWLRTDKN